MDTKVATPKASKNTDSVFGSHTDSGRRNFLKTAAAASAFMIVPRHVLGGPAYIAPSDKINIAAVGVNGKGRRNKACQIAAVIEVNSFLKRPIQESIDEGN